MSLLTRHNGNRPLRMVFRMGCTNHLKSPGMKHRITHQPMPCKQRPPGLIEVYIYLLRKVMSSFSPSQPDFTRGLLCLPRRSRTQERSRTPRHTSSSHCCCSSCRCCSHCRSWWKKMPMENAATSSLHSDLQDITYGIFKADVYICVYQHRVHP